MNYIKTKQVTMQFKNLLQSTLGQRQIENNDLHPFPIYLRVIIQCTLTKKVYISLNMSYLTPLKFYHILIYRLLTEPRIFIKLYHLFTFSNLRKSQVLHGLKYHILQAFKYKHSNKIWQVLSEN